LNPEGRERIFHIARLHGIKKEDPGWRTLALYLDNRPSDEDFGVTLHALKASFEALSADERELRKRDLILHCRSVSAASGGFWGLGKTSHAEQLVIGKIEEAMRAS
jgi:hypothetical protein